jgi:hypothetical protein
VRAIGSGKTDGIHPFIKQYHRIRRLGEFVEGIIAIIDTL